MKLIIFHIARNTKIWIPLEVFYYQFNVFDLVKIVLRVLYWKKKKKRIEKANLDWNSNIKNLNRFKLNNEFRLIRRKNRNFRTSYISNSLKADSDKYLELILESTDDTGWKNKFGEFQRKSAHFRAILDFKRRRNLLFVVQSIFWRGYELHSERCQKNNGARLKAVHLPVKSCFGRFKGFGNILFPATLQHLNEE